MDFCRDGEVVNQRDQDQIAECAWKWNPVRMLEAVRRNANRGDDLGRILRNPVPQGVSIAEDRLAMFYAMAAAHRPKGRPGPHTGTFGSLTIACAAIKKLDGPASEALARALFKLARVDEDFVQLYLPSVEECFVHALGQVLKDSKYSRNPAVVLGLVPMLVELDNNRNIVILINHAVLKECSSIAASLAKWAESHRKKHEQSRQEEICFAQIFRICGWYAGISGDLERARRCIAAVDQIAARFSRDRKDPEFELERTRVRRNVAKHLPEEFVYSKAYGEEDASAIDEIASHFPIDHREFQLERAKAWQRVAHWKALCGDAGSGYQEKAIIDEIASHFPDNDREFQLQRAEAQSDVCTAMMLHENGVSEIAAEAVEKITSRFPNNDRDLQYALARAKAVLCQTKEAQGDPRFETMQGQSKMLLTSLQAISNSARTLQSSGGESAPGEPIDETLDAWPRQSRSPSW